MKEPTAKEAAARAGVLSVSFAGIPKELLDLPQGLVWRYEENDEGELKKPPFTPSTGRRADVTNPQTWGTFVEAQKAYETGKWDGIGLALVSGLIAIDIDDCIVDEQIHPTVVKIIRYLPTYFERSPGRKGVRGFLFGSLPGTRRRRGKIELYQDHRYVTVTGQKIDIALPTIGNDQERLNHLYERIFPQAPQTEKPRRIHIHRIHSSAAIVERALNAKNGAEFTRYFRGDTSLWGEAGRHKSKSEADFQFCLQLAYWTNGDAAMMDAIFRSSALYDEKWNERRGKGTYGGITIANALKVAKYK